MIDDFIKMATSQLGINEQQAKGATGSVLGLLQKSAPAGDFNSLLSAVPGAGDLLKNFGGGSSAPASGNPLGALGSALGGALGGSKGGSGGGLLGAAMGALGGGGGSGGGGLGQLAGLMGALGNNGVSANQAPQFLSMLLGFFQQKAGGDVMSGLLKNLPDLAKLMK